MGRATWRRRPLVSSKSAGNAGDQRISNSGVRLVEKADEPHADAARQTDPHKQKTLDSARKNYSTDISRKFAQAIQLQSGMYQAWNHPRTAQVGNYQDVLTVARSSSPGYAEAIESAGNGPKTPSEAKSCTSQSKSRGTCHSRSGWAHIAPTPRKSMSACSILFASWVSERSKIAGQTVGLRRASAHVGLEVNRGGAWLRNAICRAAPSPRRAGLFARWCSNGTTWKLPCGFPEPAENPMNVWQGLALGEALFSSCGCR